LPRGKFTCALVAATTPEEPSDLPDSSLDLGSDLVAILHVLGEFFDDFSQVPDEEVIAALAGPAAPAAPNA
jgi:hypothetical protein